VAGELSPKVTEGAFGAETARFMGDFELEAQAAAAEY
jgi:hypothetical protein